MRLRSLFVTFAAFAALVPASAFADSDGSFNCSGFGSGFGGMMGSWGGGMMGYGGTGLAISTVTTALVWLVLGLLAAYLWKRVK
ncbi:MAG: hypothetical protein HYS45_00905 [Parcubacteria group bacterium]|nr:hypothetical protein [Parcubacteria group bacterium]